MINEQDYPTLFGTTTVTWAPIDVCFSLVSGEIDPTLIARAYVVPFIGDACVVIGFDTAATGGQREEASSRARPSSKPWIGSFGRKPARDCAATPRLDSCAAMPTVRRTDPTCPTCMAMAMWSWLARRRSQQVESPSSRSK